MKHPLWILNSALALLLFIILLFSTFSRQRKPYRQPITPEPVSSEFISIPSVNTSKIYEHDIFDTYEKEKKEIIPVVSLPVPQPPAPTISKAPDIPKPTFLEPLNITLKGIIYIAGNEEKNRAIIQDKQTTREASYKVGSQLEDAQLIRIFNNKIVLLRTNGQQEVIYLREKDAQLDPAFNLVGKWDNVVKKLQDNYYLVNPHTFAQRIENLSQIIDLLDLTTAYQKGTNIGCRIGTIEPESIGSALGFEPGDIITAVDGIPATATADRFAIYKNILQKKDGQTIHIELLRKRTPVTLVYTLEKFSTLDKKVGSESMHERQAEEIIKNKQLKAAETKKEITPMTHELKRRERGNMRNAEHTKNTEPAKLLKRR